jgi:nuclear transport factor 2 (NTF2) superfamily protein
MAEDAWNSRDPVRVSLAYTEDSRWRNRSEFFEGRARSSNSSPANGRRSTTIA